MGYRFEVRALIYGDPDKMLAFKAAQQLKGSPVWEVFAGSLTEVSATVDVWREDAVGAYVTTPITVLSLWGESWKWYADYPEVLAWEDLLIAAQDFGLDTEFVRVGEDATDIQTKYNTPNYEACLLGTRTTITCEIDIPAPAPADTRKG